MKPTINSTLKQTKKTIFATSLFFILAISLISLTTTQADNTYNHTTYILAAAKPSPIGIGQTIYLTYLIENVPPLVLRQIAQSSTIGAESP